MVLITAEQVDAFYKAALPLLDKETASDLAVAMMELDNRASDNEKKVWVIATVVKLRWEGDQPEFTKG